MYDTIFRMNVIPMYEFMSGGVRGIMFVHDSLCIALYNIWIPLVFHIVGKMVYFYLWRCLTATEWSCNGGRQESCKKLTKPSSQSCCKALLPKLLQSPPPKAVAKPSSQSCCKALLPKLLHHHLVLMVLIILLYKETQKGWTCTLI